MKKILKVLIGAKVPVLIWGPPGVGKTATVVSVAEELGLPIEVVLASIREPSDFTGLPVIQDAGVKLEAPAWAHRLHRTGRGILFLDEISTAPPAVQAALLRVVLDRVVGDLELPPEVVVVAAANPPEQAAGGWDLSAPLANRFCHVQHELDMTEWVEQFPSYWGSAPQVPGLDEGRWAQSRGLVASFIRHRPQLLLQVPNDEGQAGKAWPSPRTWDMASRLLAVMSQAGDAIADVANVISGCVGAGPAMEYMAWVRDLDLPDPEDLLQNPKGFVVPQRGDQAYAILTAVTMAVVGNLTESRWLAAWDIMSQAASQGKKDVAAAASKTLAHNRKPTFKLPKEQLREFVPLLQQGGAL